MTFDAILAQVLDLLQRENRASYRDKRHSISTTIPGGCEGRTDLRQKTAVDEDNRARLTGGTRGNTRVKTPSHRSTYTRGRYATDPKPGRTSTHPAWTARGAEDIVHTQPAGVSPAQEAARMAALPGPKTWPGLSAYGLASQLIRE